MMSSGVKCAQRNMEFTLNEAIVLAQQKSPEVMMARNSFISAYWRYRSFRADLRPSLILTSDPTLNRSINKVTLSDGADKFVEQNLLTSGLSLSINQNVTFTGGILSLTSNLERLDLLSNNTASYRANLVTIGYRQSLFGYNSMKWNRKTEPLYYAKAKKEYAASLELVSSAVVRYFFDLAQAQNNLRIARYNYACADTLYRFAQRRYKIGSITENDMLQHEINKLTEEANVMNAEIELDNCMRNFRSYLGIPEPKPIIVKTDDDIPSFKVDVDKALRYAYENNPNIDNMQLRHIESDRQVAVAKSNAGFKADLYVQLGLTQTADKIKNTYRNPMDQQYISINISLPILDWGRGRGNIKVAENNRELEQVRIKQELMDFEQTVKQIIKQFNLQATRVSIARKMAETSRRRYDVAMYLYWGEKISMLELNNALSEKDSAQRGYITALADFWNYYFTIRKLTLYDFYYDREITREYELLIK